MKKIEKKKQFKSYEFIIMESQRWNVSAFISLHQDFKMVKNVAMMFKSIKLPGDRSSTRWDIIACAKYVKVFQKRTLNSYVIFLCIYIFSFLLLFHQNIHCCSSNIFHHLKVLMKVYWNWNIFNINFPLW